jgi:hypothetical protein
MKHEHTWNSDVETVVATAADAERSKTHAPVKVGRAIVLLFLMGIAVATTGIVDRRHDEERLAHWTNEQAIPTVALISARRGSKGTEVVLPGDVEAFYNASIRGQASGYGNGAKTSAPRSARARSSPSSIRRSSTSALQQPKANWTRPRQIKRWPASPRTAGARCGTRRRCRSSRSTRKKATRTPGTPR